MFIMWMSTTPVLAQCFKPRLKKGEEKLVAKKCYKHWGRGHSQFIIGMPIRCFSTCPQKLNMSEHRIERVIL